MEEDEEGEKITVEHLVQSLLRPNVIIKKQLRLAVACKLWAIDYIPKPETSLVQAFMNIVDAVPLMVPCFQLMAERILLLKSMDARYNFYFPLKLLTIREMEMLRRLLKRGEIEWEPTVLTVSRSVLRRYPEVPVDCDLLAVYLVVAYVFVFSDGFSGASCRSGVLGHVISAICYANYTLGSLIEEAIETARAQYRDGITVDGVESGNLRGETRGEFHTTENY